MRLNIIIHCVIKLSSVCCLHIEKHLRRIFYLLTNLRRQELELLMHIVCLIDKLRHLFLWDMVLRIYTTRYKIWWWRCELTNYQNVMFGCGFMMVEKLRSFVWLFKTFLKLWMASTPLSGWQIKRFLWLLQSKGCFPLLIIVYIVVLLLKSKEKYLSTYIM